MEQHTGSCGPRAAGTERFHRLADVHRCFLTGSVPQQSAADVAALIFSCVSGAVPGEDREPAASAAAQSCHENAADVMCFSVSVVEDMSSLVFRSHAASQLTSYCTEVLELLFQHMDLMSQLVHHFQNQEQIISHLAAKSVAAYVVYHLHKFGSISPVWQKKCAQAFDSPAPGPELDACLWSLSEVLKRLLRTPRPEILRKLLAAFDCSLCALCSKLLPDESEEAAGPHLVEAKSSRCWGTTCCLLLDLLEALAASALICDVGLRSQRLTHIHSPALLATVSQRSSEYFVKKRTLLLLKRAVIQKAGEDWALGDGTPTTGLGRELSTSDVNWLAQSVLKAVAANWLETVEVGCSSFFGGTRCSKGADGQKPDCVMLRGVSLLLLKAMELHIQTAQTELGYAIQVNGILQSLWSFLRRCSVQMKEATHLCSWVSLLFGEQDDDMIEAAKALLSIFLHHRPSSATEDDVAASGEACASGCNPHCHFLFLLQSVSFNHSILLDFLISTETCFLEYFVRYLKYFRTDRQGFAAACWRISCSSSQQGGETFPQICKAKSSSSVQPAAVSPPGSTGALTQNRTGSASGLRLVEYDSSEGSDSESMEFCEDEPGASLAAVFTRQERRDSARLLCEPGSATEGQPDKPTPHSRTFLRAVLCLSELREVVTRLQRKKLFPYNPSSLLKLLAQVELPEVTSVTVQGAEVSPNLSAYRF